MADYRNNHYVPVWYQKGFITRPHGQQALYRLDLSPETYVDSNGDVKPKRAVHRKGPVEFFKEADLYTVWQGADARTDIERVFFGEVDRHGRGAVSHMIDFEHPRFDEGAIHHLLDHMCTQRFRTPKGLRWLSAQNPTGTRDQLLREMVAFKQLYHAIWAECIWQIADARKSKTKFIFSDHPVTTYNRAFPPDSSSDPDLRMTATHTVFPLSSEKVLILTNLTWLRNPYQSEIALRPNPALLRQGILKIMDIQVKRSLSEQEVREINFIIKRRAYRYVAGDQEEWLFPERHVDEADWSRFGNGYLLMPDPRSVDYATDLILAFDDRPPIAFDEYGRQPGHPDYRYRDEPGPEFFTLQRFKGEFARLFGPQRRGRAFKGGRLDPARDSPESHQYYLSVYESHRPPET